MATENPKIRPLESGDLPAATALLSTLNPEVPLDEIHRRLAAILTDHSHYYAVVAILNNRLTGLAGAWIGTKIWCGKFLEIDNLVVDENHRSTGIGSLLIQHLENLAREENCKVVTLDSYTSNHPSHRLYHRLGFEIWGFHFVKPIGDWQGTDPA